GGSLPAEFLDPRAWLLGAGFALHSMGIPFTTVALFTLLARWAQQRDVAWWAAAAFAAATTVAGHAAVLLLARALGTTTIRTLVRRWATAGEWVERVDTLARSTGGWWTLAVWRWVGPGFAQAFWVLCALPRLDGRRWALLAYLTAHDLLWCFAWTYALLVLHVAAPAVAHWLDRLAWVLLPAGLLWAAWAWRGKNKHPRAGAGQPAGARPGD
ncbi:MAG TPA: hypothetical protein VIK92_06665, partial [Thermaerobacter sp.]